MKKEYCQIQIENTIVGKELVKLLFKIKIIDQGKINNKNVT